MLKRSPIRAVAFVGLLIVLLVLAGLVIWNWDAVKSLGEKADQEVQEGHETIEDFKDDVKDIEEKMKDRLEDL